MRTAIRSLLLSPKSAKSREISRKFVLIAVHGHPRHTTFIYVTLLISYFSSVS